MHVNAHTTETGTGTVLSRQVNAHTELFLLGLDTWWKNLPRKAWQVSVPLLLPLPCSGATVCTKAYGVTLMRNRKEEGGPGRASKEKNAVAHMNFINRRAATPSLESGMKAVAGAGQRRAHLGGRPGLCSKAFSKKLFNCQYSRLITVHFLEGPEAG